MVEYNNDRCICADGFIADKDGCHPCAKHEVVQQNACVCADGFARMKADGPCLEVPKSLGVDCNASDTPCPAGKYDVCHALDAGAGYCTNACTGDSDCDGGYTCNTAGPAAFCERPPQAGDACNSTDMPCTSMKFGICHISADGSGYCTNACSSDGDCSGEYRCHDPGGNSFCRRPATGHGDACTSDADCAGKEADYCETIQSHLCLVRCGAGNSEVCFEGESCCDFAVFNPICVPTDQCTANGGKILQ
jgi:hypothetical protein